MIKEELIKRSPVRVFEETLEGGLGAGNLGVFTSRKGVGKTASLVHIATDKLMRGQHVLHISFADDPRHIESWYEQVFREVTQTYKLEQPSDVHDDIIRNRLILHFKLPDIDFTSVRSHFESFLKSLNVTPEVIIVDGYPFETASVEELAEWKAYAQEMDVAVWFSATLHRENLDADERGIPSPVKKFYDLLSVIIMLNPKQDHTVLELLKSESPNKPKKLRLKLDPNTLLISNHRV